MDAKWNLIEEVDMQTYHTRELSITSMCAGLVMTAETGNFGEV